MPPSYAAPPGFGGTDGGASEQSSSATSRARSRGSVTPLRVLCAEGGEHGADTRMVVGKASELLVG